MTRAAFVCSLVLIASPALAADWIPRASKRQHAQLLRTLHASAEASSTGEREMDLLRASEQEAALIDVAADPDLYPNFMQQAAWEALGLLPAPRLERLLYGVVRRRALDTPQPVLERLGQLARSAEPNKSSLAEKALLSLLKRAQQEPTGDWTNRLRIARALAEGGGRRSARALVRLLGQSRPMTGDERQLSDALATLATHREVTVCQTLVATATKAETPHQRYLGHTALAAVASPRTRTYLRGAFQTGARERFDATTTVAPDLRASIEALAKIDTRSTIQTLIDQEQFIPRDDVALRTALYKALGQARRSARSTDLVAFLVEWLGDAEADSEPKALRKALVESLRSLTGKRFSAHHATWARYVASLEE